MVVVLEALVTVVLEPHLHLARIQYQVVAVVVEALAFLVVQAVVVLVVATTVVLETLAHILR